MNLAETTARIAACAAQIPGISTSFTTIPRVVQDAQLPAVVVLPGTGTYAEDGAEQFLIERQFKVLVLVKNATQGVQGEYQGNILSLIDAVIQHFLERPGLELSLNEGAISYNATVVSDEGYQNVSYGDEAAYLGTIINMKVTDLSDIEYQDGV